MDSPRSPVQRVIGFPEAEIMQEAQCRMLRHNNALKVAI
jgi:hypothetical protein